MTNRKHIIIIAIAGLFLSALLIVSLYPKDTCSSQKQPVRSLVEPKSVSEFDSLINSKSGNVVVKFFATWCGPCKKLAKTITQTLAPQYTGRVVFVEVDVDKFPSLQRRYGVNAFPTLIYFKNGKKIYTKEGSESAREISVQLDRQFNL